MTRIPARYPASEGAADFEPSSLPNLDLPTSVDPGRFTASSPLPDTSVPTTLYSSLRSHRHTTSTVSAPPTVPEEGQDGEREV